MSTDSTQPSVFLIVRGDVDMHYVISAHASFEHAKNKVAQFISADENDWESCSLEDDEIAAWSIVQKRHGRVYQGRMLGYFAIEEFALEGASRWTATE